MRYQMEIPPKRPEDQNSKRLRELMEKRGWLTFKTHGSAMQAGLPDLLCWHQMYGFRMVETKMPNNGYTPAQREVFHKISAHGGQIWTLLGCMPVNDDYLIGQIERLHGPANWFMYL